ncbi:hypothetical protein BSKO_12033 [Bryopsis sp. KO-2023]|nr:hypothetical protein BSKO_12033 [Bryopsis sp. KO-2023]
MNTPQGRENENPRGFDGSYIENENGSIKRERGTPNAKPFSIPDDYESNVKGQQWCLTDFKIGKPLSSGKFGNVYLAQTKKDEFIVALKIMLKSDLRRYNQEIQLKREVEIQDRLDHPNCLKLYTWFHDEARVYLVLEYAVRGDLWGLMVKNELKERDAAKYVLQVVEGMIYLHQNNIVHRDIKPENLLISCDDVLKISDFGWSIRTKSRRKTICGTLDYIAPELVNSDLYLESVDIWSIGVLTYELVFGNPPFAADDSESTKKRIASIDLKFPSHPKISYEGFDLISKILRRDPANRLTLQQIKNHPWFAKQLGPAKISIKEES